MASAREELNQQLEQYKDRFHNSRFGYWNSLITINGIIITMSSLSIEKEANLTNIATSIGCVLSTASIILTLLNYAATTNFYKSYFTQKINPNNPLEVENSLKQAQDSYSWTEKRGWSEFMLRFCLGVNNGDNNLQSNGASYKQPIEKLI